MLKRSFTGPFWFMLVLGVVACGMSMVGIRNLQIYAQGHRISVLKFLYLPAIILIETIMYWMVRKRNSYRKASWCHLLLFTFAYLTPYLEMLVIDVYLKSVPLVNVVSFIRFANKLRLGIFWGVMMLAHIFFARVIIKSFSKPVVEEEGGVKSENMLDDVLG
jgi:hypothetical protein